MSSMKRELRRRWEQLHALQDHYRDFRDFYHDCSLDLLGFDPSNMQYDIADFMQKSPLYSMVQAQRGEAKTTIAGCYGVWRIIHDPTHRVLILSAGGKMSKQIATWCIQIINGMPQLECLRCDKSHPGARASVEAYDVHHLLKGANKSPSIACLGITATIQGYRADTLIADDIESSKNSLTQTMRDQLRHLTRDFSAVNREGKILYLGTPQSIESIYNDLPARGYTIRIWPGRYPTQEEELHYGPHLAPSILEAMAADTTLRTGGGPLGDRGKPTDPVMMSEEFLSMKEIDQGLAYFNLQYMLNTALTDEERFPLKAKELMIYSFDSEECPGKFIWSNDVSCEVPLPVGTTVRTKLYRPAKVHDEFFPYSHKILSVDPAGGGQNGDETGVAVIYAANGYFVIKHVTGIPGGTQRDKLVKLMNIAIKYGCNEAVIEQNYGNGAYGEALRGVLIEHDVKLQVSDVWSTGQKEVRIVDDLEPVLGAHKLLIDQACLEHDVISTEKYAVEKRQSYQFLHQLTHLTRDRGSLLHEDRLEAVSQGVKYLIRLIKQDPESGIKSKLAQKFRDFVKCPVTGAWRLAHRVDDTAAIKTAMNTSVLDRFRRRR